VATTNYRSVDEYIAAQPEQTRATLAQVRAAIREVLPGATEMISYQMPAYRVAGRVAIYFAGWKKHYSLYPVSDEVLDAFREELAPYDVNEKGTARFPLNRPVPIELIGGIARILGAQAEALTAAKQAKGRAGSTRGGA
jgi:uncharacterized protein YdhG (YjbR/CyaY superfamily)